MTSGLKVTRIDHNWGSVSPVSWEFAVGVIKDHYVDLPAVLKSLEAGEPVRCTFATYQMTWAVDDDDLPPTPEREP